MRGTEPLLVLFGALVLARVLVWLAYRRRIAATADPRALAALDAPGRALQLVGTVLPLALVALPVVVALSGEPCSAVAGVVGTRRVAHRCLREICAGHAGRLQPGVLARAPAGARRAAITGGAAAKRGRRDGCDHHGGSRRQREEARSLVPCTRRRRRCRATASRRCSCRACARPCATRTTTCRCIARASTPRASSPTTFARLRTSQRLPFTVKTDLRDHYPFGLFARPCTDLARLHASSGTTGKPTVVGYTRAGHRHLVRPDGALARCRRRATR